MSTSITTIERIYRAAEQLFADKGFSETSLRLITTKANVNLAAVNYYFGSKKGLVEAVFSRYLTAFCSQLEAKLNYYEHELKMIPSTEELLTIFMDLIMSVKSHSKKGVVTFMRLLSGALMQKQLFLHEFLIKNFGEILYRYILLLKHSAAQKISDIEWFWRVYFSLGTLLQNLSSLAFLKTIIKEEFKISIKTPHITHLMIPFITAGLSAQTNLTDPRLLNAKFSAHYIKNCKKNVR